MPRYKITAQVTVDVEMEIEDAGPGAAEATFMDRIMMTAGLADVDEEAFVVIEDSISDIKRVKVALSAAD